MANRLKTLALNISQSLGFVPGAIAVCFAVVAIGLVEVDGRLDLEGLAVVFHGDASAARTVLQVIAGSLITVAGLTFSITMVVLQLASSQFSPRILRTFFGDRVTQVTMGFFVGTFVYSLLVLRAVGSFGSDPVFVPRLSTAVASLLAIVAVGLLVVFLHHVSQMVQVSHVTAKIGRDTLGRVEDLFPAHGEALDDRDRARSLLTAWRAGTAPGRVHASRPGFVQRVGLDDLAKALEGEVEHVAVLVCAGDFVSVDAPIAEVWPAPAVDCCRQPLRDAIAIGSERDMNQDADFGVRQIADTAIKAMSPSVNDPTTAVTCIGYIRSILVRITERAAPPRVHAVGDGGLLVVARRRSYAEHLEPLLQISRYVGGDAWVAGEVLCALQACLETASRNGDGERARVIVEAAETVAAQAIDEAGNARDRRWITALRDAFRDDLAAIRAAPPAGGWRDVSPAPSRRP